MRTLLLVLALLVATAPAEAAPITYEWSGTVNPATTFPTIVPTGTPISFGLTYDLDQANTCAAGRGFFSISATMSLMGNPFGSNGGGIEVNNPLGNVCNDPLAGFQPGDQSSYELRLFFPGAFPVDHAQPNGAAWPLAYAVILFGAPFDGTLHGLGAPIDASVIVRGFGNVDLFSGPVSFQPVSVPEPGILALTAFGFVALRRRAPRA